MVSDHWSTRSNIRDHQLLTRCTTRSPRRSGPRLRLRQAAGPAPDPFRYAGRMTTRAQTPPKKAKKQEQLDTRKVGAPLWEVAGLSCGFVKVFTGAGFWPSPCATGAHESVKIIAFPQVCVVFTPMEAESVLLIPKNVRTSAAWIRSALCLH